MLLRTVLGLPNLNEDAGRSEVEVEEPVDLHPKEPRSRGSGLLIGEFAPKVSGQDVVAVVALFHLIFEGISLAAVAEQKEGLPKGLRLQQRKSIPDRFYCRK